MKITKSQEKAIERLRRDAVDSLFFGDDYEFKAFEIIEGKYNISIVIETGMIGDEGTMAEIFGRDRAQFFIGKRGGIHYWRERKHKRNDEDNFIKVPYNRMLQAVIDQR